jgi:hypothetical protein
VGKKNFDARAQSKTLLKLNAIDPIRRADSLIYALPLTFMGNCSHEMWDRHDN